MAFTQTLTLDQLTAWARQAGLKLERLDYSKPLNATKILIEQEVKRNFAEGHGPDGRAWKPRQHNRPSGRQGPVLNDNKILASAGTTQIFPHGLVWSNNLEYAAIHQYGGVITPKRAKALAIPLTKDAWRAKSPRQFPRPLFIWRSPDSGKAFLAEIEQKKKRASKKAVMQKGRTKKAAKAKPEAPGKLVLHYLLTDSVTIPARPFAGWSQGLIDRTVRLWADFYGKAMSA